MSELCDMLNQQLSDVIANDWMSPEDAAQALMLQQFLSETRIGLRTNSKSSTWYENFLIERCTIFLKTLEPLT